MNIKHLIEDDDAVSPVIGVILMVAITVILAAVIATFVLGLGDQVSNTSPQASFGFDWNGSSGGEGDLDVTHNSGDTITANNLYIRGDAGDAGSTVTLGGNWYEYDTETSDTEDVTAGNRITLGDREGPIETAKTENIGSDGEIDVVYETQGGDSSATLGSWTGPDA